MLFAILLFLMYLYIIHRKPKKPNLLSQKETPNHFWKGDLTIQDKIGKIVSDRTQEQSKMAIKLKERTARHANIYLLQSVTKTNILFI